MNDTNRLDNAKDEVLVANNAQTIFDHINELEKDKTNNAKRWFWELLQNAKDSVQDDVSIDVELLNDKLIFKHSGNPFREEDILHLIFHGSSKIEEEGKVGRFGTGFMSTHLLSRQVTVKGKLVDGKNFNFLLNRTANKHTVLKTNLDTSYEQLKESLGKEVDFVDGFNTIFEYDLSPSISPDGFNIASDGLNLLPQILPIVLALNPKIKSIKTQKQIFKKNDNSITNAPISDIIVEIGTDLQQRIITQIEDKFSVSILLEKQTSDTLWRIRDLGSSIPRLFYDFPLFGTEKLGIPFIINSLAYEPKRERDAIYLKDIDNEKIKPNVTVVENAFDSYEKLLQIVLNMQDVSEKYNLFLFRKAFDYDWLNTIWFSNLQKKIIVNISKIEGFHLSTHGEKKSLNDIIIPYTVSIDEGKLLYNILKDIFNTNLVSSELHGAWINILENHSSILECNISDFSCIIDQNKICKIINDSENLQKLASLYFNGLEKSTLVWLDKFLNYLSIEELSQLSIKYKIVPNQEKLFLSKSSSTSYVIDNRIDEKLKDIAESYGWRLRSLLIHDELYIKETNIEILEQEKVLDALANLNYRLSENTLNDENKLGIVNHFKWLIKNQEYDRLKTLRIYLEGGKGNLFLRQVMTDESKKLIIPSIYWEKDFSLYKELIPQKHLMLDEYSEGITMEEYQEASFLFFIKPLIEKQISTKKDLGQLVKYHNQSYIIDNIDIQQLNILYSDIPYLVTSDDGILDKTARSLTSTIQLLKFIFNQILLKDPYFNQTINYNGLIISNCLWLERLKEVQWVAFQEKDDQQVTTIKEERATTSSLSAIINSDDQLKNN